MLKKREEVIENMFNHHDINQRIDGLTLPSPPQETDVASCSSYTRGTLGLTLSKTASFDCLLEASLHKENQAQPLLEKLKASNFPINSLKIGYWQRISTNDGHLTAKLYYAKQKIVWEVLEGPLKRKMEIHWSDIIGINAVMPENQPATLRIELDKPPLFFKETDPQPRKHTIWQQASDFTDDNATTWRTHCLTFPPGVLNIHYEKLLQCYKELVALSRKPFPSHEIPIFSSAAMHLAISNIHFNPNGFQPQEQRTYFTSPTGPPPIITPNPSTTANLHGMNSRARNLQQRFEGTMNNYHMINVDQGRSSMFTSEVMRFDEIAPLTQDHISAFLNPDNSNSARNNWQMMMDYQMNDCALPMGGYANPVPQPHNGLPHNDMATEMDNFINPPFVSPDNLTANANLLPDQRLLPDNHTVYGTPFHNQHHPLPDNDLTTPVNPYMYQDQHDFPGNLTASVNHRLYQNQDVFPDNLTALVNHPLYQNQHGFPDNLSRGNPYRK